MATARDTAALLAGGILRSRVKREIQEVWDPARTLVVSEFGANLPWSVSHAMTRNRTICGLARAMVLIEARATGGSIQAGRDCFRLRLMKSRSTGLPNVGPIVEAIGAERVVGQLGLVG